MSSSTASGALSLLNSYGGNNSMVSSLTRANELNQQQAEQIKLLRQQLANATGTSTTASTTGTSTTAATTQSGVGYPTNGMMGNPMMGMMQNGYPMAGMMNQQMYGPMAYGNMMGNPMMGMMNSWNGNNTNSGCYDAVSALTSSGKPVSSSDLQKALEQNANTLKQRLAQICQTNNINVNQEFKLNLDSSGQIVVNGSCDQKDKLQTALRADSGFTQLFISTKKVSDSIGKMSTSSS